MLAAVDRLYSTGLIEAVWPQVVATRDPTADAILVVRVDAPERLSVSLGAGYENDRGGRAWFAFDRYTSLARRPAFLTAAASTDGVRRWAALSGRVYAHSRPGVAWGAGAHVHETSIRVFTEDVRTTVELLRTGGWLGLEFPRILRDYLITVTGYAESVDPENAAGGGSFGPLLRLTSIASEATLVGVPLLLEGEARWGTMHYQRIGLAASVARRVPPLHAAALLDVRAVSAGAPLDVPPALGDEHAVPGLRWGEGRGRARIVTGIDVAYPVLVRAFLRLRARTGAVADEPAHWENARWTSGAQLAGGWRLPLGLVEIGYGRATTGDGRFDVSIGRSF